ncbi:MAG: hypothetical protein HY670_08290 [Chloroflexi bacterium]|nr:hypothetical protein [Chloroflexota bacterium]
MAQVIIAITLVFTLVASLVLSAPIVVKAFTASLTVANSPISLTTTYLLGEKIAMSGYAEFDAGETKNIEMVQLSLTGAEFSNGTFVQQLPTEQGSYTLPGNAAKNPAKPGVLGVTVTWDPGIVGGGTDGTGYGYGYGYGTFTNTSNAKAKIKYNILWTPPVLRTIPPSPPPSLPGSAKAFDIDAAPLDFYPMGAFGLAYDQTANQLFTLLDPWWGADQPLGPNGLGYSRVLVTDLNGNHIRHFRLPIEGYGRSLSFHNGELWVGVVDPYTWAARLIRINPNNGSLITDYTVFNDGRSIQGLASDGTNLWASGDGGHISKINPADGTMLNTWYIGPSGFGLEYYAPADMVLVGYGNTIGRFDPTSGTLVGWDTDNTWLINNVQGLAQVGNDIYMAQYGEVRKAHLPIAPADDVTVAGGYTATIKVTTNPNVYTQTDEFSIEKVEQVTITVTDPQPNFFSADPTITIKGSVNDPTIDKVSVGVSLPDTSLLKQTFENGLADETTGELWTIQARPQPEPDTGGWNVADGLWHSTTYKAYAGTKSAWYGQEQSKNYETVGPPWQGAWWNESLRNRGSITSPQFKVGANSKLSFYTRWQSDFGGWDDQKLVQVYVDGQWQNLIQIVDQVDPWLPEYAREMPDHPEFEPIAVPSVPYVPPGSPQPPLPGENGWIKVEKGLNPGLLGKTIRLRWFFDTRNPWSNFFEGWFIDNIEVTGAGFKGKDVAVTNMQFETTFGLAEGQNEITVTASNILGMEGEVKITGALDTTPPTVSINAMPPYTKSATIDLSGNWGDVNPKVLTITQNNAVVYTTAIAGNWQRNNLALFEGNNVIKAIAEDKAGWTSEATASIILDTTPPSLQILPTKYYTGEVSARVGDMVSLQVNANDAQTGIDRVEIYPPGGGAFNMMPSVWDPVNKEGMPDAFLDQLGLTGNYVSPFTVWSGAMPGTQTMQVKAFDKAGNFASGQLSFKVVSALEAFNFYLMPDWNLISLPLTPTATDGNKIENFVAGTSGQKDGTQPVDAVWSYDAATGLWSVYTPLGSATPVPVNTLLTVETGKGYWLKTNTTAFNYSDPIMEGFDSTPVPVKLSYAGKFLKPGELPPVYEVVTGWNLAGYHSEKVRQTSLYLAGDVSDKWVRLIRYDNYFKLFFGEEKPPEVILGAFRSVWRNVAEAPPGEPYQMEPGQGFWAYFKSGSQIVPLP